MKVVRSAEQHAKASPLALRDTPKHTKFMIPWYEVFGSTNS